MEDRPIRFHLLNKDELIYEVLIRNAKPAEKAAELRVQIRDLAKQIPTDEIVDFLGDTSQELTTIQAKIEELNGLLALKPMSLKNINRLHTLGNHLYHRLGRLHPTLDEETQVKDKLWEELTAIFNKVDRLFENFKSSQTSLDKPAVPPATSETEDVASTPPPVINVSCGKVKAHSLNIKFDGRSCVVSFVQRLEELCSSRGISDDELLKALIELFVDDALIWYRGVRSKVKSWGDVKTLLFAEYLPFDYEDQLLDEIRARTQGHSENIAAFLSIMQNYFSRLPTPLGEAQKLKIAMKNVRPFYSSQLALVSINSWESFKQACKKLEHARVRSERFVEPPRSSSNMVAPDLVFKQTTRTNKPCAIVSENKPCVRCRADTHNVAQCPQPASELICYRCGEKGFTARTCVKCNPQDSKN